MVFIIDDCSFHFTMRTYGVNQAFRFVEGIWLHQKSRQIQFFAWKRPNLHNACAARAQLSSNISTLSSGRTQSFPLLVQKKLSGCHSITL